MMDRQERQLDYNQLLLQHLDRISFLSSTIQGVQVLNYGHMSGTETHFREADKRTAFMWSVKILDKFIPDMIKDDEYEQKKKKLIEEKRKYVKCEDGEKRKHTEFSFWPDYLGLGVNLLARKGFLLQTKGIGKYVNKPKKAETEEVWEQ